MEHDDQVRKKISEGLRRSWERKRAREEAQAELKAAATRVVLTGGEERRALDELRNVLERLNELG